MNARDLPPIRIPRVSDALRGQGGPKALELWRARGEFSIRIRLLPDADEDNMRWWRDAGRYILPFRGTRDDPRNPVVALIPHARNWDLDDPIEDELRRLGERDDLWLRIARRIGPRISAVVYGFVRSAEGVDIDPPDPYHVVFLPFSVRRAMIESARKLPPDASPVDPEEGYVFVLERRDNGRRVSFDGSHFDRRPDSLRDDEIETIRKHGWLDLRDAIGRPPPGRALRAMPEILEACLRGELYDREAWPWFTVRDVYDSEADLLDAILEMSGGPSGHGRGREREDHPDRRRATRYRDDDERPRRRADRERGDFDDEDPPFRQRQRDYEDDDRHPPRRRARRDEPKRDIDGDDRHDGDDDSPLTPEELFRSLQERVTRGGAVGEGSGGT